MTDEEAIKVVDVIRENKARDKILMVGTGRESAWGTIEFTKKVAERGADFASVLTPHYFASKMTDEVLLRFFIEIAEKSPLPVLIYNAPKYAAGVVISPEVISVLSQHPNIVGMKDTSEKDITEYIKAVPQGADFFVLAGSIKKYYKGLISGAVGGIISMANYLPERCCEIQELYNEGNLEQAEKISAYLCDLSQKVSKNGVAGIKACMDILGYYGLEPRIPLLPLSETQKCELRQILFDEGIIYP